MLGPSVVYPAPENADADWKDATSGESPVIRRATDPIRTISSETAKITWGTSRPCSDEGHREL